MSFPDVSNQEDPFQAAEDSTHIESSNPPQEPPQEPPQSQSEPFSQPVETPSEQTQIDPEEEKRVKERLAEEEERRKKITEKIELELKIKNENREKAVEYMNEFESKRQEEITKRKAQNIKNEEDFIEEKKLGREGKKNPWESVVENITVRESEYKGSKDVSRMRQVILSRKNDELSK